MRKRQASTAGLTIIELMISMLASSIMVLAAGAVLFHGHRGWAMLYRRATSEVVSDAYAARGAFDAAVRKSTYRKSVVGVGDDSVEVYYYASLTSTALDRYANFHLSGSELRVSHGPLEAGTFNALSPTHTVTLARNVTAGRFAAQGSAVRMHVVLDNGTESLTVDTSAVRHNE